VENGPRYGAAEDQENRGGRHALLQCLPSSTKTSTGERKGSLVSREGGGPYRTEAGTQRGKKVFVFGTRKKSVNRDGKGKNAKTIDWKPAPTTYRNSGKMAAEKKRKTTTTVLRRKELCLCV